MNKKNDIVDGLKQLKQWDGTVAGREKLDKDKVRRAIKRLFPHFFNEEERSSHD